MIAEPTERVRTADRTYRRENVPTERSRAGSSRASATLSPLSDRRRREGFAADSPAAPTSPALRRERTYYGRIVGVPETVAAPSARPMGRRRARGVAGHAKERPVLCAVLIASFCVMSFSLYLNEYARVTDESLQQSKLTKAIAAARQQRESLNAEISALTLPSMVRARAEQVGMVPNASQSADLVESGSVAPTVR